MEVMTQHGIISISDFLNEITDVEEIIKAYRNFNGDCPIGQKGISERFFEYQDEKFETMTEICNIKVFLIDHFVNKTTPPNKKYDYKIPYIDKYDMYSNLNNPTWEEKVSNLFKVFEDLIIPSLTSDNIKVIEKSIVQGIDTNTSWTIRGVKWAKRAVYVAIVAAIVTISVTLSGIIIAHRDAIKSLETQNIEQQIKSDQTEAIINENIENSMDETTS